MKVRWSILILFGPQLTVQRLHAGHVSTNAPESFVEQRGMDVSQQMGHNKNAFREMNPPEMRM